MRRKFAKGPRSTDSHKFWMIAPDHREGYLDTWRAIACLLVYFYHSAVNVSILDVPFYGLQGVNLFFVLSGYLLGLKFLPGLRGAGKLPEVIPYLCRRFIRIYPPYFVCLAVFTLLRYLSGTQPPTVGNWVARATLIFNYLDRYDFLAINGVFWSLAIEMQFYLLLPVIGFAVHRVSRPGSIKPWLFAGVFLVTGMLSRFFEVGWVDHSAHGTIAVVRFRWAASYLDLFGVGILLRLIEDHFRMRVGHAGRIMSVLGLGTGVGILALAAKWTHSAGLWDESRDLVYVTFCPLMVCLGFATLVGVTSVSNWRDSIPFRWSWLQWIGRISYSIYLYHTGVLYVFNRLSKISTWGLGWTEMCLIAAMASMPITLVVGWMAYRLVEVPCMQFRGWRSRAKVGFAFDEPGKLKLGKR